ncbi:hypothetical protein IAD21_00877 [Abditibacteriota bacterium]|nr:hypothetical protein IAD21_00877 [Abditibacteriota bacterium]
MENIAQKQDVFNTSSVDGAQGNTLFTLKSGERYGVPVHTVTTRSRDFYMALFEAALEYDNSPDYKPRRGIYTVEFIASDAECFVALEAAQGFVSRGLVGVA